MKYQKNLRPICKAFLISLSIFLLFGSAAGCSGLNPKNWFRGAGAIAAETFAQAIEESITNLTGESEQWRQEWTKTRTELPEDVRKQFDIAFENALKAASEELKCDTDFIRSRLKTDLEIIVANLRNKKPPTKSPQICKIYPEDVVDLDKKLEPKDQTWIAFAGWDFTDPENNNLNVRALIEFKNGKTKDLTQCCVDSPTLYLVTIDFDEFEFTDQHRRIVLEENSGEELGRSVAISYDEPEPQPLPEPYWTDTFSEEGSGEMKCKSGFAVAGIACYGDYCDNKELLCRPYTNRPDNLRTSSYWHSQVISEEKPNASFRSDKLSEPALIAGLKCSGRYCDNISFYVITTPYIQFSRNEWEWKPFFSEESPGSSVCNQNQFVLGLGCRGDYCDNISILCSSVKSNK